MIIKICGITQVEEGKMVQDLGGDWIGLVFAPSRRRVSPEQARKICRETAGLIKVGVFTEFDPATIGALIRYCGLDMVQLHGQGNLCEETLEGIRRLGAGVIRSHSVQPDGTVERGQWPQTDWVLLDTKVKGMEGGTGIAFAWDKVEIPDCSPPFLVAGGLNPDNVMEAIQTMHPWGVDVSGGVEKNGGKDPELVGAFIQAVRNWEKGVTLC